VNFAAVQVGGSESADRTEGILTAIGEFRHEFEEAGGIAEEDRTLPLEIVEQMRQLGLFWLKTPAELGGSELTPVECSRVLEELAYCDASVAWAAMVGNGTTGTMAGWLPREGVEEIFSPGDRLPIFAGQFGSRGSATPARDGFRVSGRWSFCSGIEHADWVVGGCQVEGEPGTEIVVTVPKREAELHDTWFVAGLQGTGSGDFSLSNTFVPTSWTFDWNRAPAMRGGPLFRQPHLLFIANELSPVAVGVARRAIDDMISLASDISRRPGGAKLSDRPVFQRDIARVSAGVRSVQLLYRDAISRAWDATREERDLGGSFIPTILAEHTLVVEMCSELVTQLFRYGGGRVLALNHPMQRHVRNLIAAKQHVFVTDENYEVAGRARLADAALDIAVTSGEQIVRG